MFVGSQAGIGPFSEKMTNLTCIFSDAYDCVFLMAPKMRMYETLFPQTETAVSCSLRPCTLRVLADCWDSVGWGPRASTLITGVACIGIGIGRNIENITFLL